MKSTIHASIALALLRNGIAISRKLGRLTPCDVVIVQGRRCWHVATRTVGYATLSRSRGQTYPRQPTEPEGSDVMAYPLPDGVIRREPPLKRLRDGHSMPVHRWDRRVGRS